ncbi:hypothetical protein L1887_35876 [Cichorium endivia]|nr:hypothetical protein L1887_35876 [Cichorium endivia]
MVSNLKNIIYKNDFKEKSLSSITSKFGLQEKIDFKEHDISEKNYSNHKDEGIDLSDEGGDIPSKSICMGFSIEEKKGEETREETRKEEKSLPIYRMRAAGDEDEEEEWALMMVRKEEEALMMVMKVSMMVSEEGSDERVRVERHVLKRK